MGTVLALSKGLCMLPSAILHAGSTSTFVLSPCLLNLPGLSPSTHWASIVTPSLQRHCVPPGLGAWRLAHERWLQKVSLPREEDGLRERESVCVCVCVCVRACV